MAQSTVFEQIIKLIPRTQFQSLVGRRDGKHIDAIGIGGAKSDRR